MASQVDPEKLDHIEQFTKIAQMQADINRKQQEIRFAPWQLVSTGIGVGAALLGAGAAISKLIS